ncbi:UDP-2,4-diacetamido-2,4,6-trideoxy-beta-L-altropyranose hydrolase [Hymenobacter perfusus]|uniref:UDP-2,4-diacetamido-2,4, 6-trideoxy-beta-L-altropyranose hydrolase n=2 Tax=Hymenobacter perfusus TaxID=1236770 RepID=A0A3R9NU17_9BACT|nr:UDP-2,4-diacetamido-2,4,6-trideoxy-beta-L-altropyranose hydrolase [Hymenobacter perfusus]
MRTSSRKRSRGMTASRILFRTDGNSLIGLGHLTRCLALADMLASDFVCTFALREPSATVEAQVQQAGFTVLHVPLGLTLTDEPDWLRAQISTPDILVLDGYHFTPSYQQQLKQHRQAVVYLDDLVSHYMWADVVLNQAGGISASSYRHEPGTQLCLGPAYALLRRPFRESATLPRNAPDTNRVFLNMGGADPENHTLAALKQVLQWLPQHRFEVVTGSAYPHQATLQAATQDWPNVQLHHNLTAEQMAVMLQRCGIYICPPSGIAYECCAVGGLVLLHLIADNQQHLFTYLTENGLALPVSQLATLPTAELPATAHRLQQRQQAVFDGLAAERLRQVFRTLALSYALTARRATAADSKQYLLWANDPAVRSNAIRQETIAWEQHQRWFSRRLDDAETYLYYFEQQGQPVGQVRLEFTGSEALIDYSVAATARGQGLGLAVLLRAILELRRERPGPWTLVAQVKAGNLPSRRVFERVGFALQPAVQLHGSTFDVFRLPFLPPN